MRSKDASRPQWCHHRGSKRNASPPGKKRPVSPGFSECHGKWSFHSFAMGNGPLIHHVSPMKMIENGDVPQLCWIPRG